MLQSDGCLRIARITPPYDVETGNCLPNLGFARKFAVADIDGDSWYVCLLACTC